MWYSTSLFLCLAFRNQYSTVLFEVFICFHIQKYIAYAFSVWLISLNITSFSSMHFVTKSRISFFSVVNNISLCMYTKLSLSIYLPINTSVNSISGLLWIVMKWTCMQASHMLISFPLDVYSEVGMYGRFIFKLLRKLHIVLHNGYSNLYSHQK
jgi:hypothetical protein